MYDIDNVLEKVNTYFFFEYSVHKINKIDAQLAFAERKKMVPTNFEQYVIPFTLFASINKHLTKLSLYCSVFLKLVNGDENKKKTAGTDTAEKLRRLSRTRSRSELECDEDFLGTTGRKEVQLAHKQETAEATNTMGFPVYPPPYRIISHFTHSHLCLSSRGPPSHPAFSSGARPPDPHPTLLQHHGMLFLTLLMFLVPHPHLLPTAPIKTRSDKCVKCSF